MTKRESTSYLALLSAPVELIASAIEINQRGYITLRYGQLARS